MSEAKKEAAQLAVRSNVGLGDTYIAGYSDKYAGWCVFKNGTGMFMEYHAGAFSDQAIAVSEAKRLNDLKSPNEQK